MARNASTITDDTGEFVDWVELYNPTDNYIQLNGMYLSKYDDDLLFYEIDGTASEMLLAPGEFILFWLDDSSEKGPLHTNFELSGSGGFLALSKPNGAGVTIMDSVYYTSLTADISYGRYPDATSEWIRFDEATPGSTNNLSVGKISGLHINEILARNSSVYLNDVDEYDDWIELYNSSDQDIDVGGLYFSDNKSDPFKFKVPRTSPGETTIKSKGFLMLFPSGKPESGVRHLNFQLAGGGEHVSITQRYLGETVILDSITYPALSLNKSWGSTNDGGQYWAIFLTPTPNATNGTSAIDDIELDMSELNIYPNPATETIYISFTYIEQFDYSIEVVSPLAQKVRLIAEGSKQTAFSRISLSFDVRELGLKSGTLVFFRIRINDHNYIRKILITGI